MTDKQQSTYDEGQQARGEMTEAQNESDEISAADITGLELASSSDLLRLVPTILESPTVEVSPPHKITLSPTLKLIESPSKTHESSRLRANRARLKTCSITNRSACVPGMENLETSISDAVGPSTCKAPQPEQHQRQS